MEHLPGYLDKLPTLVNNNSHPKVCFAFESNKKNKIKIVSLGQPEFNPNQQQFIPPPPRQFAQPPPQQFPPAPG